MYYSGEAFSLNAREKFQEHLMSQALLKDEKKKWLWKEKEELVENNKNKAGYDGCRIVGRAMTPILFLFKTKIANQFIAIFFFETDY